ncbi:hypothetical protein B0O80DRAFT_422156 [Mortierella sp. GBAus27b]|nr:hypothetical protein BGX31_009128 [Mortierella sp. GBA43]KAI8361037.1 hypothetical protein B0O80DRAFT_422156 [Mortierella sp. GBAus27b]
MPSSVALSGKKTQQGQSRLLLTVAALAWLGTASANVRFSIAADAKYKPGDTIVANWTLFKPPVGVENTSPFLLVIRAASGQKYDISPNVQQSTLNMKVRIPQEATGGPHSFYAYYVGSNEKSSGSNQFIIDGPVITTPGAAGADSSSPEATGTPDGSSPSTSDSGISSVTLIGIIAGAVVVLIAIATLFICRHRRRVADSQQGSSRSMEEVKEIKNKDMEPKPSSGGADGGMVAVPLNGAPGSRPPRPESLTKNPFENPDAVLPPTPRSQHQQAHQYTPPQLPPVLTSSNSQRSQGPFSSAKRESFESEIESVYDPNRPRMVNGNQAVSPAARPAGNGANLTKSASGRSTNSSRYPRNMTPQPQSPAQSQDPFMQAEREVLAAAAAAAAASSTQRPLQHQPSQTSINRTPSQPIDVHQHHLEQQQKALKRQQEKEQKEQQQKEQEQQASAPLPAAQQSIDPTQFDDKAEVEEEDKMPAYNGYRDTIFGAYAPAPGDEDEEEEAVPALPPLTAAVQALTGAQPTGDRSSTGGAEIVRKKSVKFTGVLQSGPVVLPNNEAAREHQAQRKERHQQQDQSDDQFEDASGSPSHINTSVGASTVSENALSPVRSPNQAAPLSSGFSAPQPSSSDFESDVFGAGFYEDVLAAVEKSVPSPGPSAPSSDNLSKLPPPPTTAPAAVPPPPAGLPPNFVKPVMPLVPRPPSPTLEPTPLPQQLVQQHHIPAPQPQHFQPVPVTEQVYGAPSPRVTPAVVKSSSPTNKSFPSPSMAPATIQSPGNNGDNSGGFYEASLL